METRNVNLQPNGVEHVITIHPALTISGTVSDATTGQPIPRFRIITGSPQYNPIDGTTNVSWSTIDRFWLSFDGGKFQYTYQEPAMGGQKDSEFMFKFIADGYAPVITSPVKAAERSARFDVALTPAPSVEVTVLSPEGKPEANADIGLGSQGARLSLIKNGFSHDNVQSGGNLSQTDDQGQFALPPDQSIIKVFAASPNGYAETTPAELAANPVLQMLPWGRIEGVYETNGQPCAQCTLSIQYGKDNSDTISFGSSFRTKTDNNGHFAFAQVPPGKHDVAMTVFFKDSMGHKAWTDEPLQSVEVQAGETTTITIGNSNQADQANSNSAN